MKKYLIAIAMVLTLGQTADAASQKHRHSKVLIEQVDSVEKPNDAIEAFSDTTTTNGVDDEEEDYVSYHRNISKEDAQVVSSHVPHCPAAHHLCDLLFRK